jgi:outer membrane protein assembly complex protein YaeT
VEREEVSRPQEAALEAENHVHLVFVLGELPFLTSVEYAGSRLLSKQQIERLLAEKKLAPKLGEPENRVMLHRVAKGIEAALRELGHPDADVVMHEEISPGATVKVRFEIRDGPHVPLARVDFVGHAEISTKRLRRQMQQLRAQALFANLRGKDVYTPEAFEKDRARILTYYQNHGYPEARVGAASVWQFADTSRQGLLWRRKPARDRLAVAIPVEAGPLYKIDSNRISAALDNLVAANRAPAGNLVQAGKPYSAEAVENLRRAWQVQTRHTAKKSRTLPVQKVEALQIPDPATHTMRINFRLSDVQPYLVRRLQFEGIHRFPDRYFRKRMPLKEGAPLDDHALEAGLARLARTGYFKPIKKEDIRVETNDVTHTADITIHVEELGQQRISFLGGRGQFGSTLGIAYMLYNLLDREELLSSRIEGGPESVQLALGLAKEGFLGSRSTLALSVFNTFLRPRLVSSVKGPFYTQQAQGFSADWSYALTPMDTLSVDYGLSHSKTQYSLSLPAALAGLPASDVRAESSSHSLALGWERDTGNHRITLADSVSGGLLGGSENLLRGSAEYARIVHDPLFSSHNAWAFRTTFSGAGSYSGSMPLYARGFAGDQFVRGLGDGELGPYAVVSSISATGATSYSGSPTGANAISAVNAEYRMPLGARTEAATFFDLGSGRLLPNWLGPHRPSLIDSTNGLLHGSTGLELRWTVPGVDVPLRAYYALNVLRLNRVFALPDGSLFKVHNRFSTLGWGLGTMF